MKIILSFPTGSASDFSVCRPKALCLSPVLVAVSILLLLACLMMLPSAPPVPLGSAPISGPPVFTMICWKGVSFPLGMAIDLISLLWVILRSSYRHWPPRRLHYGPRTMRGKLVRLRRLLWWTLLLQILLRPISLLRTVLLWAPLLGRVCPRFGRCPGSCLLFLPVGSSACATSSSLAVSSLRARSRSPSRTKRPLVLLRPRGDGGSTVVTGVR